MNLPNEDLWGLNPSTGRLYNVQDRRQAMDARGSPSRYIGGPLPDPRWDEWFDRVNYASSGLPEDFNASQYGGMQSKAMQGLNDALVKQAAARKTTGWSTGGMPQSIADNPHSTWNTNQEGTSPWGTGGQGPLQGLHAAGKLPPLLTPQEQTLSRGRARRQY